jgi:hypothetical protein
MTCNTSQCQNGGWVSDTAVVPIEKFFPYAGPYIEGVADEMLAHQLRISAIEFARDTKIVMVTVLIDVQAGVRDYALDIPDGFTVYLVHKVRLYGHDIQPNHQARNGFSYSKQYGLVLDNDPCEDGTGCLEVDVVVIPGQDTCVLPTDVYDRYADVIGYGALASLYLMANERFLDRTAAGIYRNKYIDGRRRARQEWAQHTTTSSAKIRPPRFI